MNVFGKRLRILLEEKNIEGKEFAKAMNVQPPTVSNWLNGNRFPKEEFILKIADFFNVTTDYLLGKSDVKEAPSIDNPALTAKDEKDIAKTMDKLKEQLASDDGLMFDGEIMDDETKDLLLQALEQQERMIKTINKKYIPKRYRDK